MQYTKVPDDDPAAIDEVSQFIHDIGSDVNMTYDCYNSTAVSSYAVSSVIVGKYGLHSIHYSSLYQPTSIAGAMDENEVIYARGTDSTYGGHAWVIDGSRGQGGDLFLPFIP